MNKKLNLGCYNDIKEGYVNLDKEKYFKGIDITHNLEKLPYPFKDNTFEEILVKNALSHIDTNRIKFFNELHRISKPDAKIIINEPFREQICRELSHKGNGFTFTTFIKLCGRTHEYRGINKFDIIKFDHQPTIIARFIPSKIRVFLSRFFNDIINNVIVEMKVIK